MRRGGFHSERGSYEERIRSKRCTNFEDVLLSARYRYGDASSRREVYADRATRTMTNLLRLPHSSWLGRSDRLAHLQTERACSCNGKWSHRKETSRHDRPKEVVVIFLAHTLSWLTAVSNDLLELLKQFSSEILLWGCVSGNFYCYLRSALGLHLKCGSSAFSTSRM